MSSHQPTDNGNDPYNIETAALPTPQPSSYVDAASSAGYIKNIEPQFNDSHPTAQPPIDYTAPQQPYFINPYSNNNTQMDNPPASTNSTPNSGYVGSSRFFPNLEFLLSIPGILNLIAIFLLLLAWVVMAAWRGHIGSVLYFLHSDGSTFFFLTTLVPFFVLIIYLGIVILGVTKYACVSRVELNWTMMACNGVSGFLLIVSSSIVARRAEGHLCLNHNCQILETAAAFGFLSGFMLAGVVAYYFMRWRKENPVHQ